MCAAGQALMLWSKITSVLQFIYWASIYLLKVNYGNTIWMCEICYMSTINTPERCHWRRSGAFTVNFKQISHLALVRLVFLLLTLNRSNFVWVVKAMVPQNQDTVFLLFVRNIWFIVVRGKIRTCDTSKMELFGKIVYSLTH